MTKLHSKRSIAQLLLTAAGMAGIVGLFLPFTRGVMPASELFEWGFFGFGLAVLPAFLSVFASAASIRWIVSGSLSRLERVIAYVASTAAVGVLSFYLFGLISDRLPLGLREWLSMMMPLVILLSGIFLLIRNSKTGRSKEFNPVMAILIAYSAYATLWLTTLYGAWEAGAYCILVAVVAFLLQTILISAQPANLHAGREAHQECTEPSFVHDHTADP